MNKRLLLVTIFCLTSCKMNDSSNEESILTTSFDVFSYYQKEIQELNNVYLKKTQILDKNNKEFELLTKEYWDKYNNLISYLQNKLQEVEIKDYFIEQIGKDEVDYLLNIDTNRIFYSKKYIPLDINKIDSLIQKIKTSINLSYDYYQLSYLLDEFLILYEDAISSSLHINVLSDLYLDNKSYQKEKEIVDTYIVKLENDYKYIFKELLSNEYYKELVVEDLELNEDEISYFLVSEIYSKEVLTLFEEESQLENKYLNLSTNSSKLELFIELVNIRKQISNLLGYSSYVDYVYKSVYQRNYTLEDVNNLLENIFINNSLKNSYLYYSYKEDKTNYYSVNELDLLNNLEYVKYFLPESEPIIKELKTYGFYNFDYRNNKYKGSYKTYIDIKNKDQFILLNVNNNINDYLTLFHEFGHYLSGKLEKDKLKGNKFDLDIAEVHSQSLEYIMSSYYHLFLSEEESRELDNRLLFNALWTIYSSSIVSEFENYVYLNDVDISNIQEKFDSLIEEHLFPYSFGMDKNHYLFTNISHIYTSPCYYISYLTSIIPSLILWSEDDQELVKKQYKTILEYGTSNDFIYVLDQVNLPSPFEKSSIDLISRFIEKKKTI
ncbi:MAG: hypothetical protein E7177_04590 [Erysipelotrichaceae bacterium]|nr:hypothetical protein [Erysipelotrichaceae bacterium]